MVKNAAGDFTFAKAIAASTVTSAYFTYEIGAGGAQQTFMNNPHSYTVGTSCRIVTPTATKASVLTLALIISPNPSQGRMVVAFAPAQAAACKVTLYDVKGARVKTIGTGSASVDKTVALLLNADELANGIYLVKLTTSRTVVAQRLVVSR